MENNELKCPECSSKEEILYPEECPKCNSSAGWDNGYCSMCGFREIKNGK